MSDLPPSDTDAPIDDDPEDISVIEIQEEMEHSFLDYAMSVIVSRALPDARDGLKPVHRRILWSMYDQGFRPDRSTVKCARVVGDVMARFHPHGDSAIYDALARMAQPFSLRHPLIDFKGNYGSPEDPPAAARYTECRLDSLAMRILADIDESTVDFIDNYSGDFSEPAVLPARFPNLLVNGSQGIAVGMATNIPPHNLGEVIDAVVHLIANPDATADDLMEYVRGPDFPTGGQILGRLGLESAYRTGRGSVKVRARAEIAEVKGRTSIVVTELPYQVSAGAVARKIADLVNNRELDGIADVNDESSGDETRFLITLKRDANPEVVLNNLWKHTPLQTSFAMNMVALVGGGAAHPQPARCPRRLPRSSGRGHHPALRVPPRRGKTAPAHPRGSDQGPRPHRRDNRHHPGLRRSSGRPRAALMAEPYEFSEVQANHILDMTLGRLTRLGRSELETEAEEKRDLIAELEAILADPARLRGVIRDELIEIRGRVRRRTAQRADHRSGRDRHRRSHRRRRPRVHHVSRRLREDRARRRVPDPGSGWVEAWPVPGSRTRTPSPTSSRRRPTRISCSSRTGGASTASRPTKVPVTSRTARGTSIVNLLPLQPDERVEGGDRHPRLRDQAVPVLRHCPAVGSRRRGSMRTTRLCGPG